MTGGCGRLLSTEAVFLSSLSPLSLSSLSHAPVMPPLLSSSLSLSSLSVLALQGFDRVFGCVVWAVLLKALEYLSTVKYSYEYSYFALEVRVRVVDQCPYWYS